MMHIFFFSSTAHGRDHYFQEVIDGLNVSVAQVAAQRREIAFPDVGVVWHFVAIGRFEDIHQLNGREISATLYGPDWKPDFRLQMELHSILRERLSRPLRSTILPPPLDTLPPA